MCRSLEKDDTYIVVDRYRFEIVGEKGKVERNTLIDKYRKKGEILHQTYHNDTRRLTLILKNKTILTYSVNEDKIILEEPDGTKYLN